MISKLQSVRRDTDRGLKKESQRKGTRDERRGGTSPRVGGNASVVLAKKKRDRYADGGGSWVVSKAWTRIRRKAS